MTEYETLKAALELLQALVVPLSGFVLYTLWRVSHKVTEIDTKLSFVLSRRGEKGYEE
jgi:hypothetical protein